MAKSDAYKNRIELVQGTLDMLLLRTLQWGPQHGYGMVQALRVHSGEVLQVETGSLYPALHRLERQGWVRSEWKQTESNQRAKYYRITAAGKKQLTSDLSRWEQMVAAVARSCSASRKEATHEAAQMRFTNGFVLQSRKTNSSEELRAHLRMAMADRMERGESEDEARRNAMRELGNVPLIEDVTRAMWGGVWLERVLQDVRYALRQLRRAPGFAVTVVVTLALGLGATVAMYTVVDRVMLRPLPYRDAGSLVSIQEVEQDGRAGMGNGISRHCGVAGAQPHVGEHRVLERGRRPPRELQLSRREGRIGRGVGCGGEREPVSDAGRACGDGTHLSGGQEWGGTRRGCAHAAAERCSVAERVWRGSSYRGKEREGKRGAVHGDRRDAARASRFLTAGSTRWYGHRLS